MRNQSSTKKKLKSKMITANKRRCTKRNFSTAGRIQRLYCYYDCYSNPSAVVDLLAFPLSTIEA